MKVQFFTLLAVAVAAMALPQDPSANPSDVGATDAPGPTETFPTVVPGTGTVSPSDIPIATITSGSASDVPVTSALVTTATGNSTSIASSSSTSKPTSLSASTSRPVASTSTFSTATGAAYSVRSASVPLAVVAGILGASQMF